MCVVFHLKLSIACAAGNDHSARADGFSSLQNDFMDSGDLSGAYNLAGDSEVNAKLQGLKMSPTSAVTA